MKKEAIKKSLDGKCPYCGSDKVFIRGRANPRPSSSTSFSKSTPRTFCADCDLEYLPKRNED